MRNKRVKCLYLFLSIWTIIISLLLVRVYFSIQERYQEESKKAKETVTLPTNTFLRLLYYLYNNEKKFYIQNNTDIFLQGIRNELELYDIKKPIRTRSWNDLSEARFSSLARLKEIEKNVTNQGEHVVAVLVMACNRLSISRCLDRLIKFRPSAEEFPIIVAQDCVHKLTADVILSYEKKVFWLPHTNFRQIVIPDWEKKYIGYYKIARHYKFALNHIFNVLQFSTAIVVEDDLLIAEDFFEYFKATRRLLTTDPSVWCVSAWNDNGAKDAINEDEAEVLYRTDFFPGLGWMLTKKLWDELYLKWPASYWDDWMRHPNQRKNRVCIRPEVSRTFEFSTRGTSNGVNRKYLDNIRLNNKFCKFTDMNLEYLEQKMFDAKFFSQVYNARPTDYKHFHNVTSDRPIRIEYSGKKDFEKIAADTNIMRDFYHSVPRNGYKGIVPVWHKGRRVFIVPRRWFLDWFVN